MPMKHVWTLGRARLLAPGTHPSFQTTFIDPNRMCDARSRAVALLKTLVYLDQKFDIELAVGEAIGNAHDHACEKAC